MKSLKARDEEFLDILGGALAGCLGAIIRTGKHTSVR